MRTLPILFILQTVIFQEVIPLESRLLEIQNCYWIWFWPCISCSYKPDSRRWGASSIMGQSIWNSYCAKWQCGRFLSSVFPCTYHATVSPYLSALHNLFQYAFHLRYSNQYLGGSVTFFICLPRVHLANATVLMTTVTMLNCKFNSVFRIQGKFLINLRVSYILHSQRRIVHFFKTETLCKTTRQILCSSNSYLTRIISWSIFFWKRKFGEIYYLKTP